MNTFVIESFKALDKASDAIETATYDLKGGYTLAAVNRSYYAMFYCMTALLIAQNVYAKTHNGLKAKFNELFIKTEIMPQIFQLLYRKLLTCGIRQIMI